MLEPILCGVHKMNEIIHDVITGKITERNFTPEEIAAAQKAKIEFEAAQKILDAEKAAKAEQRLALLERLGITEEEAAVLLG